MARGSGNKQGRGSQPKKSSTSSASALMAGVRAKRVKVSQPRKSSANSTSTTVEDEVIIDIKEMIQGCGDGLLPPDCCISRVPATLRHLNEEAYTPQFVSIGPFHHGIERLQNMERHKQILFKRFTQRFASSWHDLVPFVKQDLVSKVCASYSETIDLSQQQLVKLILMDAVFIIVLFKFGTSELRNDAKLSQQWSWESIRDDLLLIENQLPFVVIEELFDKVFPQNHQDGTSGPSFLELAYDYFGYYNRQNLKPNDDVKIKHFTDLLRLFYRGEEMPQYKMTCMEKCLNGMTCIKKCINGMTCMKKCINMKKCVNGMTCMLDEMPQRDDLHAEMTQLDDLHVEKAQLDHLHEEMHQRDDLHEEMHQRDDSSTGEGSHILLYNANALQEAGIKLKASKSKCLLDLEFSGHILEIPQTLVEDGTEVVFRNMIALEQCHYPKDACITNYALILDRIIDTSKDVDLLVDEKIVCHYLGDSHKVASFFNKLCKNVVETNFNPKYLTICKGLNRYCENSWHKKRATLRRDYCNTPWHILASIAGIILLVLTIVQTIFSVLQVVLK